MKLTKDLLKDGVKIIDKVGNCYEYIGMYPTTETPKPEPIVFGNGEEAKAFAEKVAATPWDAENLTKAANDEYNNLIKEWEKTATDSHVFDRFETGSVLTASPEDIEAIIEEGEFEIISMDEWKKRIIAFVMFNKAGGVAGKYKNYLQCYDEINWEETDANAEYSNIVEQTASQQKQG